MNIEQIKFDEKGLVPTIIQDYYTKEVLTQTELKMDLI